MSLEQIQIEVARKHFNDSLDSTIKQHIVTYINANRLKPGTFLRSTDIVGDDELRNMIVCVVIEENPHLGDVLINTNDFHLSWFFYNLNYSSAAVQNDINSEEDVILASHLVLPNADLINSWENLHYGVDVKINLLRYAQTLMKFSDGGIDSNIVSCNKVILLHGPPGTGKTSLCKALAQKLSIRMQARYKSSLIVEINSHSLFSKYFSESGKLVNKVFSGIRDIVADENIFVCLLIDEVESLARAREQCISGVEPSDAIRAVNAVLTQIDQMKSHKNVLILATSNLTKSIDIAFVDRADIKQFLGLPEIPTIYRIYLSCIHELQRVGILENNVELASTSNAIGDNKLSKLLLEVSEKSVGLSGRALRKIPFVAYSLFDEVDLRDVPVFLLAMLKAVEREKLDRSQF